MILSIFNQNIGQLGLTSIIIINIIIWALMIIGTYVIKYFLKK